MFIHSTLLPTLSTNLSYNKQRDVASFRANIILWRATKCIPVDFCKMQEDKNG